MKIENFAIMDEELLDLHNTINGSDDFDDFNADTDDDEEKDEDEELKDDDEEATPEEE